MSSSWALADRKTNIDGIPPDTILTDVQRVEQKNNLKGLISKHHTPAKNDYIDNYDRGTVLFNSIKGLNSYGREVFEASNYSYHKILIPNGTTIKDVNFSQKNYDTDAIEGEDLIFEHCNLVNILIHPSWVLISCNTTQKKEEIIANELVTYNRDSESKWIEVEREEITP